MLLATSAQQRLQVDDASSAAVLTRLFPCCLHQTELHLFGVSQAQEAVVAAPSNVCRADCLNLTAA
jgi:hypothetical protein